MTLELHAFIEYIKEAGTSENTRQAYERDLRHMIDWLKAHEMSELHNIGGADLMEYIDMMTAEGKAASTISRSIAAIKKFFAFTHSRGYTFSDPSKMLKAPKVIRKSPAVLSERDIRKLLNIPDISTAKGIRDKAMLELLVATGLCVSEIIALGTEDVDISARTITAGKKSRKILINKKTADYLKNYSKVRKQLLNNDSEEARAYFLSCSGGRLSRQGCWKLIRNCGRAAGIEELTPQMLRHSFAISALKHGKDVAALQKMLGHSSKAGSMEYQNMIMG